MSDEFKIKKGDTAPAFGVQLFDSNRRPIQLAGATVVFRMRLRDGLPASVVEGAATIDSATRGEVSYHWQVGDTDVVGEYYWEWEITFNDGTVMTIPGDKYGKFEITKTLAD